MNALDIKDLVKDYGDFRLNNVSFTLPSGFIMGLVGPNGAGKTTIINTIMNLVMKQKGEVKVFEMDHQKQEVEIKKRIGFVYDSPTYYEHLTLNQLKNIIAPFYENWDEKVYKGLVDRFELPANKLVKKFSKGMKMKGAIAIALSHHADLIIMDEPTSGLDPIVRREMLDFLRNLIQDENKSILFSSHITTDIEQIADYITYVLNGEIVFSKNKDEVFEQYALIKGGNELLNHHTRKTLIGVREGEFGFEGLTQDVNGAKKLFGAEVIYDRASLEDIMFFTKMSSLN
ncbi:MAG: ABC transporter ATP-binding protein [Cyclobacteriaceae bacterium]|nr:ABC transporter ATP-binding protein [Cyclobacteriaceae bacterium HetDA_MAG_MS6]